MFFCGLVLTCGLNTAVINWQYEEGMRKSQAVLAEVRKSQQELEKLQNEIDRMILEGERRDAEFLRKYGPYLPRPQADELYRLRADLCKKYGIPPLPPLPPLDKK